jgi:hypothetical protein
VIRFCNQTIIFRVPAQRDRKNFFMAAAYGNGAAYTALLCLLPGPEMGSFYNSLVFWQLTLFVSMGGLCLVQRFLFSYVRHLALARGFLFSSVCHYLLCAGIFVLLYELSLHSPGFFVLPCALSSA